MVDGVCHGGRDPLEDCTMTNNFNRKRDCFVLFSIRMLLSFILEDTSFSQYLIFLSLHNLSMFCDQCFVSYSTFRNRQ